MKEITNDEKVAALKKWLKENNVEFKENYKTKAGVEIDLWLPKLFIAVHVGDDPESKFYRNTFMWCKPFFVRESESKEFVLEKIQNCCYDQMMWLQKRFERNNKKK